MIRKMWIRSLALSLGLVVTGAQAQEVVGRSTTPANTPPPTTHQPVTIASSRPAAAEGDRSVDRSPVGPAAQLGKPIVIAGTPQRDENVRPASFSPSRDSRVPVVRGSSPDSATPLRPMPIGPNETVGLPNPGYSSWRKADDMRGITVSRNTGAEAVAAPPPATTPGVLGAPTPVPSSPSITPIPAPGPIIGPAPGMVPTPSGPFPPPVVLHGPPLNGHGPMQATPCPPCPTGPACPCPTGQNCFPGGKCASGGRCRPGLAGLWCGTGGGDACDDTRFVLGVDSLYWWMKGDKTPPLVNAAPPGTPLSTTAFSNVLFGGTSLATEGFTGVRLRYQWWFSDAHLWGLDGSAFYLGEKQDRFFSESSGNPQLGRPIINLTPGTMNFGQPDSELVAGTVGPITTLGSVQVLHRTNLWGFDVNLRRNLCCGEFCSLDLFFGYRQLGLDESIAITENVFITQNQLPQQLNPAGTLFVVRDKFSTSNRFFGGQVGFDTTCRYGDWTLGMRASVALGNTQQTLDIAGSTTTVRPAGTTFDNGGLLAGAGTNIGSYSRKMFGVIPEVGVTLGYDVFDWMRCTVGYNFLYWNNVARAGEQIDLGVNRNFQPGAPAAVAGTGPARPTVLFPNSDFVAHGVTFGLEFRY